ncbi:MAG: type I-E CRISPR-associated protein Cas6/Cse3/CasE [Dehalococcoidia bacterium]|nr:type I-E CRISPR-associated protein Cas6/Cse3/CasE [Dehalococcoidia bacterium]
MYLSRLQLDFRSRVARRWLADCHDLHRGIMSAFPHVETDAARAALGVLFRLEYQRDGGALVLVQSSARPDWSQAPAGAIAEVRGPKDITPLYAQLENERELRFRLRANPTRRVSKWAAAPGSNRERPEAQSAVGKRVELRGEAEQIAWLARRGAERDGFELLTVRAFPGGPGERAPAVRADPGGKLRSRRKSRDLTLASVTFQGALRVTDVDRFRRALAEGVGPGKAFGCGLLSVMPMI